MEFKRNEYTVTDDPAVMELTIIHGYLTRSTWSKGISKETVEKSLQHSMNFALLHNDQQIGFARVITDRATFANMVDVFILEDYRGKKLGRWFMESVLASPDLQNLRRFTLATTTAAWLYEKIGFSPLSNPNAFMEQYNPTIYQQ